MRRYFDRKHYKAIKSDPSNLEWKQKVTGFKLGFIRHPEFEFYSRNSVHWKASVACANCHMPYKMVEAAKITDPNVMSPLKNNMRACLPCHIESAEELKSQLIAVQDRTISLIIRGGYQTAVAAKLVELSRQEETKKRP